MNRLFQTWIVSKASSWAASNSFSSRGSFFLYQSDPQLVRYVSRASSLISDPYALTTNKIESSRSPGNTRINREIVRAYSTISETPSGSESDRPTNHSQESGHESPPGLPNNRPFKIPTWAKWVLGALVSLLVPFWKLRWDKLRLIEGKAEEVMEEVEIGAEVVEKVASVAESVSAGVADKLPDHSKLKDAALWVERLSKATAQDAHLTQDIIHKVEEVRQDVKTMVDPNIEKDRQVRM